MKILPVLTLFFSISSFSGQVSSEKACAVWSAFSNSVAESRDNGTPKKELIRKVNKMAGSGKEFTTDNAKFAIGIINMTYHEFRRKSPSEISQLVLIGCIISN